MLYEDKSKIQFFKDAATSCYHADLNHNSVLIRLVTAGSCIDLRFSFLI